jgi:hypothetical protein
MMNGAGKGVVLAFASFLTALYAFVNAFGAWLVVRRKPRLAFVFMVAAALLMVAAAALVTVIGYARVLLLSGLVLASVASYLNASVVIGRVVWRNHAIRAAGALLLFALAHHALTLYGF